MALIKLFLLYNVFMPLHDVSLARYLLKIEADVIKIQMEFDQETMNRSLQIQELNKQAEANILDYIQKNTKWVINDKVIIFDLSTIQLQEDHYYVAGVFPISWTQLFSLTISNTCLLNIDNHSNIIHLAYQDKQRTFRLHQKRTTSQIQL